MSVRLCVCHKIKVGTAAFIYVNQCGRVRWSSAGVLSSSDLIETQGERCLLNNHLSALINNGQIPREKMSKAAKLKDQNAERERQQETKTERWIMLMEDVLSLFSQ